MAEIPETSEVEYGNMIVVFKIKKYLKERRISANTLKWETKTDPRTYASYAKGTSHKIDFWILDRWCQYLGCKLTDLIEFRDKE